MAYDLDWIKSIIAEINDDAEIDRRALAKRRHDIYRDGGKAFLIEQIKREFGNDALNEMRLAPVNLLKKIVNKRASIYKKAPQRKTIDSGDQKRVDYYVKALKWDQVMQKANRYFTLSANTVIYTRPNGQGGLAVNVVPSYLYSIVPNAMDQTKIDSIVFNAFPQEGIVAPQANTMDVTGQGNFSQQRAIKSNGDKVASNEIDTEDAKMYIFWTPADHFTADGKGSVILNAALDPTEQTINPIERLPITNIAKDRDNEPWATQGEDMIDLTIAIQLGWTDVLTIAKHQGFSILTITSEEEPKKLNIGINRAVWLKQKKDGPTPNIGFVQGNSPLEQYKGLLMELLGLLLTTNDMSPGSIGGQGSAKNFTSGFHALIEMSDNLEAMESDKPIMLDAERDAWQVIAKWHNWLIDSQMASQEIAALGKFTDSFDVQVQYCDAKPLESEQEVITTIQGLKELGLITKKDMMKRLYPDLDEKQIDDKLAEIAKEQPEEPAPQPQSSSMDMAPNYDENAVNGQS